MQNVTVAAVLALVMELAPVVAFGFAAERTARLIRCQPLALRLILPPLCVMPYILISVSAHIFRWSWFALYVALPVTIAWLLEQAAAADPEQRGNWRDAIILLTLGLSVDLRWFDSAWPSGLQALHKLLLSIWACMAFSLSASSAEPVSISTSHGATGKPDCAS